MRVLLANIKIQEDDCVKRMMEFAKYIRWYRSEQSEIKIAI